MLNIIIGRAGTGKTGHIMKEIKRRMDIGESGMLLIVPEQYSHNAERQLCEVCGDKLSLFAETLSFTRLSGNVLSEVGGAATGFLDAPGQILALYRALESVASNLKVFGAKKMRPELIERLLDAIKEFKSLNITAGVLERAAKQTGNPLSDKLRDLALIYDAYDSVLHIHGGDAADRLTLLADHIGESSIGNSGHIFFDGFNDFTAQELCVIEELFRKNADITICLTCDPDDIGEIFEIPRRTLSQLCRLANDIGVKVNTEYRVSDDVSGNDRVSGLKFTEKHLFDDSPPRYSEDSNCVAVYSAPSRYVECEYAAYEVLKFIRLGFRWRDVGVMAHDWDEYSSVCENVFEKYGIPYFSSGRVDILTKPPIMLIDSALEIAASGWEYKSVFKYLKSGLTGVCPEDCALLENYVLKWNIRGSLWMKDWIMPPLGYGRARDTDVSILKKLNELRRMIVKPLENLYIGIKGESKFEVKLRVLYSFLNEISLSDRISEKVRDFTERNEIRLADEYSQLWDVTVSAMEQMYTILGDDMITPLEFRKLFTLALSQNDIGVIPISLDRTALGGMAMSRRRDLKCLIIIGASDDRLPTLTKSTGALSDNERIVLSKLGSDIPAGLEERLYREMNMLFSVITLPSKRLVVIHSSSGGQRPSFISKRLCHMFGISIQSIPVVEYMAIAEKPYSELVNSVMRTDNEVERNALKQLRNSLTEQAAGKLYGNKITLSATRVDRFYSCAYKHFLQNGLKLEPRSPAEFDALTAGNFMHFVLDGVFTKIKQGSGFKNVDPELCRVLTDKYIEKFVNEVLLDFEGKSARFIYLFNRFKADVIFVVKDMTDELGKSEFEPLDLELDMSLLSDSERGFIDRVDGYKHDGKLYLRVIDYKTHRRAYSFDLSDILQGRNMQMLIYLFALEKFGNLHYGMEVKPAGVLYVPARDVVLNAPRNSSEGEINKLKIGEMRRSGLIVNDISLLEAMEKGVVKEYLPVKTSGDGELTGESLATAKQMTILSSHVNALMENAKEKISHGDIECIPYYKNDSANACNYCEYHPVCGFDEKLGDKRRFTGKMKSDEVWNILERRF